ncbi:MAG TPA: hypothetical protein VFU10_03340 [Gaiellaceae bacterium]|nr:hypothetical protein [Gaiellaceae bacterium]
MQRLIALVAVAFALTAAAAGASVHRFDLGSGFVDGHRILGRSVAGVTAALGRAAYRHSSRSRYVIGYRLPPATVEVLFRRAAGRLVARTVVLQDPRLTETKTGRLLRRSPRGIQAAITAAYGGQYDLVRSYRCRTPTLCSGEFSTRDGTRHITFGRTVEGARFLTIWLR